MVHSPILHFALYKTNFRNVQLENVGGVRPPIIAPTSNELFTSVTGNFAFSLNCGIKVIIWLVGWMVILISMIKFI